MYINKIMIYGNVTRDPDLKTLPSGTNISSFSVATNRRYKKNDEWKEEPEFHNVVVFGNQAVACADFLRKGNPVFVEGRMQTRSWDGEDGKKQYRTEIVAERVQFGPRPKKEGVEEHEPAPEDIPF